MDVEAEMAKDEILARLACYGARLNADGLLFGSDGRRGAWTRLLKR